MQTFLLIPKWQSRKPVNTLNAECVGVYQQCFPGFAWLLQFKKGTRKSSKSPKKVQSYTDKTRRCSKKRGGLKKVIRRRVHHMGSHTCHSNVRGSMAKKIIVSQNEEKSRSIYETLLSFKFHQTCWLIILSQSCGLFLAPEGMLLNLTFSLDLRRQKKTSIHLNLRCTLESFKWCL